jgi:hypothetical protein
MKEARGAAAV